MKENEIKVGRVYKGKQKNVRKLVLAISPEYNYAVRYQANNQHRPKWCKLKDFAKWAQEEVKP